MAALQHLNSNLWPSDQQPSASTTEIAFLRKHPGRQLLIKCIVLAKGKKKNWNALNDHCVHDNRIWKLNDPMFGSHQKPFRVIFIDSDLSATPESICTGKRLSLNETAWRVDFFMTRDWDSVMHGILRYDSALGLTFLPKQEHSREFLCIVLLSIYAWAYTLRISV